MYPQSIFEQNLEKHHNFSFENFHFNSREILQYITWACLRNVWVQISRRRWQGKRLFEIIGAKVLMNECYSEEPSKFISLMGNV